MRIEELEIYTANLIQQKQFYEQVLQIKIPKETKESFEVNFGFSKLRFVEKENATPYHIAIHIPDNQEKEALEWLRPRVGILKAGDDEIIDFSNWGAKSVYFYDKDLNIMELISRRNFSQKKSTGFSSGNFLGIAEIGLATNNIREQFQFLNKNCGLDIFDGNLNQFCAIGKDEGLIITIDKNLKDWFPTNDKAFGSGFNVKIENKGVKYNLQFDEDKLRLK